MPATGKYGDGLKRIFLLTSVTSRGHKALLPQDVIQRQTPTSRGRKLEVRHSEGLWAVKPCVVPGTSTSPWSGRIWDLRSANSWGPTGREVRVVSSHLLSITWKAVILNTTPLVPMSHNGLERKKEGLCLPTCWKTCLSNCWRITCWEIHKWCGKNKWQPQTLLMWNSAP